MASDLKRGDLLKDQRETAQDRGAWRCAVEDAMANISEQAEVKEKQRNDERKRMCHQKHHHGRVRRLDVALSVSPRLVWSITCTRSIDGWLESVKVMCSQCGWLFR